MPAECTPTTITADPELDTVLLELLSGVRAILSGNFVGLYLHGSAAIGDLDMHSDVDFVVAINAEIEDRQISSLQSFHAQIYAGPSRWAQHLEGAYLTTRALRSLDAQTPKHLFLDHGSRQLVWSQHDNTMLHRFVLREHAITLAGPTPKNLIDPVSGENLRAEVFSILNTWMRTFLTTPAPLQNGWRQPYTVLTLCRLLYTLRHGTVTSKKRAAEWAIETLDPRWTALIEQAWAARPDPALKARLQAAPHDVELTLAFIKYALDLAPEQLDSLVLGSPDPPCRLPAYKLGPPTS
jgi:hypothetical protein